MVSTILQKPLETACIKHMDEANVSRTTVTANVPSHPDLRVVEKWKTRVRILPPPNNAGSIPAGRTPDPGAPKDAQGQATIDHRNRFRLIWNQWLGKPECPYLQRWAYETPHGSIRLHHWLSGDDPRAHHDHGWWFVTIVLRGSYLDLTANGSELMKAGTLRYRPATHQHTVDVAPGGCWTLLVTGPHTRFWGFWRTRASGIVKWVKSNRYFLEEGHHPCN